VYNHTLGLETHATVQTYLLPAGPIPTRCKHKMGQWNSHVTLTKVSIVTTIYHTPARYSILHTPCPIAHNIIGPASAPLTLHIAMFSTISVNSRHAFAASSEWLRSVFQG
jgi:hypothetical protein